MMRWALSTTNYDTNIEDFWRQYAHIELDTGFGQPDYNTGGKRYLDMDGFIHNPRSNRSFLNSIPSRLRLINLRGSISWLKRRDNDQIEEKEFNLNLASVVGQDDTYFEESLIYPLQEKRLYIDPYILMFYLLNRELESKPIWIIVGYSFRDSVIQNIFSTIFEKFGNKKMILIAPDADAILNRFHKDHHSNIYKIQKYFGKDDNEILPNIKEILNEQ
jgi:hypothetical protein